MHLPPTSESERACRKCQAPVPAGGARCSNCGGVFGRVFFCPYCRTETEIVPSATLRFVCTICGRARVPLDDPAIERSFAELPDLRRANQARLLRPIFRVLAWVMTASAALVFLLATAFVLVLGIDTFVATATAILVGLGVVLPLLLAVYFARRARRSALELESSLDEAWLKVTQELARAHGHADAGMIARAMRLDEETAGKLAARLPLGAILGESDEARWLRLESELTTRLRLEGATEIADPGRGNDVIQRTRKES